MSIALAGFERLVVALGRDKDIDLGADDSLTHILQLLLERTDLMATALHLIKQQLPRLQQFAAGSDETMAKVLNMEGVTAKLDRAERVKDFTNLWELGEHLLSLSAKADRRAKKSEARTSEQVKHLEDIEEELSNSLRAFERLKKEVREVSEVKKPRIGRDWGLEEEVLTESRNRSTESPNDQNRLKLIEAGLQDLMKRVEDLLTGKPASSSRVVPFAGGFLRTVSCVKALIERTDDPGSIAGFADPFQFFARLKESIDGDDASLTDSMKMKKLAQELNRSEEE